MAKLIRQFQKIFAGNHSATPTNQIAVFGSKKNGAATYTNNVEDIQNSNFLEGWKDAVVLNPSGREVPYLQDMNALFYALSRNLSYLYQAGIPEYNLNTTYFVGDICRKESTTEIYSSLIDDNTNQPLTDLTKWKFLGDLGYNEATISTRGVSYLNKKITISNNAIDPNNDIDFSDGNFDFADGSGQALATAMTKRIDATWAAGTNQGGLDTGSPANNTFYYIFPIYNPTNGLSDFLFSTSSSSPNMTLPNAAGYTVLGERLHILRTGGTAAILPANWTQKQIEFSSPILIRSSDLGTTQLSDTIGTSITVSAKFRAALNVTNNNTYNWVQISPAWKGNIGTPSITNCVLAQGEAADDLGRAMRTAGEFDLTLLDTNSIIYSKTDSYVNSFTISLISLTIL